MQIYKTKYTDAFCKKFWFQSRKPPLVLQNKIDSWNLNVWNSYDFRIDNLKCPRNRNLSAHTYAIVPLMTGSAGFMSTDWHEPQSLYWSMHYLNTPQVTYHPLNS